jgi:hypothetical protein
MIKLGSPPVEKAYKQALYPQCRTRILLCCRLPWCPRSETSDTIGEHSCIEEITKELSFVGFFSLCNDSSFKTFKLLPCRISKPENFLFYHEIYVIAIVPRRLFFAAQQRIAIIWSPRVITIKKCSVSQRVGIKKNTGQMSSKFGEIIKKL